MVKNWRNWAGVYKKRPRKFEKEQKIGMSQKYIITEIKMYQDTIEQIRYSRKENKKTWRQNWRCHTQCGSEKQRSRKYKRLRDKERSEKPQHKVRVLEDE